MDPMTIGTMLAAVGKGGGGSTKVNTSMSSSNVAAASISSAISNILGQGGDTSTGGLSNSQTSAAKSASDSLTGPSSDTLRPTLGGTISGTNIVNGKTIGLVAGVAVVGAILFWMMGKRR